MNNATKNHYLPDSLDLSLGRSFETSVAGIIAKHRCYTKYYIIDDAFINSALKICVGFRQIITKFNKLSK